MALCTLFQHFSISNPDLSTELSHEKAKGLEFDGQVITSPGNKFNF